MDNDVNLPDIVEDAPLTSGAALIRGHGRPEVYLTDQGKKRHVTSPAVMDKYYFDWAKVRDIPYTAVDSIPVGDPIN